MDRREFMAAALVAPFAAKALTRRGYRAVLTTDLRVPHSDPDDYYDVACAVALGFHGVVLDDPHAGTIRATEEAGARVLEPSALRSADAVVVVGSGTEAARHYRGQRVVLFAGDAAGVPEVNELMDADAYDYLRHKGAIWVPCFDGGGFRGSTRSSWTLTHDDDVMGTTRWESWFRRYCGDVWGERSLYCGAYLGFAFRDRVAGATAVPFIDGGQLASATRGLLGGRGVRQGGVEA
jgi:hypothetical protein